MVGFLFFLLFLAGLALAFLQGQSFAPPGNINEALTATRWQPRTIGENEIVPSSGLFVEFGVDGSVRGHAGCNNFGGNLETQGGSLRVGPLRITRKACDENVMMREAQFVRALRDTIHFDITKNRVMLLDNNRQFLMELVAMGSEQDEG